MLLEVRAHARETLYPARLAQYTADQTITTVANVNSPPCHSPRRPTLDGDAGGDDGDEASGPSSQIRRLCPCLWLSPWPASASPSPADAVVGHSAARAKRRNYKLLSSNEQPALATRTHSSSEKKAPCHRRGLADLRLDG